MISMQPQYFKSGPWTHNIMDPNPTHPIPMLIPMPIPMSMWFHRIRHTSVSTPVSFSPCWKIPLMLPLILLSLPPMWLASLAGRHCTITTGVSNYLFEHITLHIFRKYKDSRHGLYARKDEIAPDITYLCPGACDGAVCGGPCNHVTVLVHL